MSDKLDRIVDNGKVVTTTQELYGFHPEVLCDMTYKEALEFKIFKAKTKLHVLIENQFDQFKEDYLKTEEEICKLIDAIKFNKNLLEELKGCK